MKLNILSAFVFICGLLIFHSCYYDNPPEVAPIDPDDISFQAHIVPIFQKSCSTSNCHDGTVSPNLTSEVAWRELQSGGYINLAIPRESILYKSVAFIESPMPPGGPQLSDLDQLLILTWIQKGSPND